MWVVVYKRTLALSLLLAKYRGRGSNVCKDFLSLSVGDLVGEVKPVGGALPYSRDQLKFRLTFDFHICFQPDIDSSPQ